MALLTNLSSVYCFWSNVFFLTEWFFRPWGSRTGFTVDNNTLLPASAASSRCLAFVLDTHISHQSRTISGTQNLPHSWDLWWLDILVRFQCDTLRNLKKKVHNCLSDTLVHFFWFSCDASQGSSVFLKIHPQVFLLLTYKLPVELIYEKLTNPWHHGMTILALCKY